MIFSVVASVCLAACILIPLTGYHSPLLTYVWICVRLASKLFLYILAGLVGCGVALYFKKPKYEVGENARLTPYSVLLRRTKEKLSEYKFIPRKTLKHKAFISRNVDDVIEELITLLLRDYVNSWYSNIVRKQSLFCNSLKPLIRQMLFTFRYRCQKIDQVKFFTSDIVKIITKHMQHVKNATVNPEGMQPFRVHPFLKSKEGELNFLRKICEFLLITLLPPAYAHCLPLRHLLKEVFACTVFYNVVDKTCDPDKINMWLISYLKNQQDSAEKHSRTYALAETYEDFIKMIQEYGSIEDLQHLRYCIVAEIMQATIVRNVKQSKGMDADKEFNTQRTNKGDLLESRNLPRYLNQLKYAKNLCESRIKLLGGSDYTASSRGSFDSSFDGKPLVPGQKVLSMNVIMQSAFCRRHFSKFLQKEEMHSLIGFWEAVEDMKSADKSVSHQLGNDIVRMYIHDQASGVRLSKNTLKGIEEFIMANKGPEAFLRAQDEVYRKLEDKYYASFIVSDIYHKMMTEAVKHGSNFALLEKDEKVEDSHSEWSSVQNNLEVSDDSDVSLFDHTSYARSQLKKLQNKLNEKLQALSALRSNPKCDKKVIRKMDKEIQDLCHEQSMLQNHIEKTELWIKYLGMWQATVVQADVTKENDKTVPICNVMVHLSNDSGHPDSDSVGWIVSRSLPSFHNLHQKLVPAANWLKKIDLPTKPRFKSLDQNFLEKSKMSLQAFLSAVTKDDSLNKSEALYSFLSPSPEHMKRPCSAEKKQSKLSLSQILKNVQNSLLQVDDESQEDLFFLDDNDRVDDRRDSIAESLYVLIGEVFELKGVFNWLRRTLISFVQITYGRTINRQLRESVSYIMSEPMLLSYLQAVKDTMWPTSANVNAAYEKSEEEKFKTGCLARQMLLNSIPEVLNSLIGHQNARKGVAKLFDAVQDKTLNKHLLYNIIEAFMYAYAPELKVAARRRSSLDIPSRR